MQDVEINRLQSDQSVVRVERAEFDSVGSAEYNTAYQNDLKSSMFPLKLGIASGKSSGGIGIELYEKIYYF